MVVDWNVNYTYKNISIADQGNRKVGNCQDFVEAVLKALGVNFDFSQGPLGEFLKDIRQAGTSDMKFKPSQQFREKFGLEEKQYVFTDHLNFDTFCDKLYNQCPDFPSEHKQEHVLLKAFDRAFWLRHIKKPHIEQYQPLKRVDEYGEEETRCPFGDPR